MQQLIDVWTTMDMRRRGVLIGAAAALLIVFVVMSRMAATPSYALLYSGLDPAAAGEVVSALEARSVRYQIRGESIFVEERDRDSLRMSLAGEGLPAMGSAGYELLDSLSGFSTTSQMFDAAYWRAKEGELARTISASPRILAARVHLATSGNDPFAPQADPSASVSIRPSAGGITASHAQALRYLVASAVPGLMPDNVTIIDSDSGRVLANDDAAGPSGDATALSEELRRNVERILNARVGPGNAVVEISVEIDTAHERLTERIIDPQSRVVIGTESEELTNNSRESGDGAVTVASNLPEGDAAGGDGSSASLQSSETRERVTYDISEVQREVENGPGRLRRVTAAVLVNAVPVVGPDGVIVQQPRDAEELEALRALVQSAIGFDAERGDLVTIESLAFEPLIDPVEEVASAGLLSRLDPMTLVQIVSLLALGLAIGFGVLRPALRSAPSNANAELSLPPLALQPEMADSQTAPGTLAADMPSGGPAAPAQLAAPDPVSGEPPAIGLSQNAPDLPQSGEVMEDEVELDPVSRLRRLIEEREEETVEILRAWMEEDEEAT